MDAAPWPQDVKIGKTMEEISSSECTRSMIERKAKPEEQLNCPRCNSTNTKFCYYNNYSLTQPRYFCKTCRRYWTAGGSLRNVPVGGGSRKNKRSSCSSSSSSSSSSKLPDLNPPNLSHLSSQNPKPLVQGQDLNLAFPSIQDSQAMELLRTGIATRGLNSYIPSQPMQEANTVYSAGYTMPTLSFPVEENGTGRILFPLQLKQHVEFDQNKGEDEGAIDNTATTSAGFWNGMFGHGNGGSW